MRLNKIVRIIRTLPYAAFLCLIPYGGIAGDLLSLSERGWDSSEKGIIDESYLSLLNVTIGETTLDEVTDIFGESEVYSPGRKENAPSLLCYKSEHDDVAVIFESGPLYAGEWRPVTSVWIGGTGLIDTARCAATALVDREGVTVGGLSLDLEISDVKNIVGEPTFHDSSFFACRYTDRISLNDETFHIWSGLEFGFDRRRLNWFRIYRDMSM